MGEVTRNLWNGGDKGYAYYTGVWTYDCTYNITMLSMHYKVDGSRGVQPTDFRDTETDRIGNLNTLCNIPDNFFFPWDSYYRGEFVEMHCSCVLSSPSTTAHEYFGKFSASHTWHLRAGAL